ncbi:MAG: hypothetical protein HY858_10435 [Candidatus Solibacter usitatus]|nr:hypothetical protein [Candidatus Solibacter usitatus]
MLSEDELHQIGEEMERRASARRMKRNGTILKAGGVLLLLVIVVFVALLVLSRDEPRGALMGQRITATGAVIENGSMTFSGSHYVTVFSDRREIKCYTERSAPVGAEVTLAGTVVGWTDGVGGSLRPCAIIR